MKVMSLNGWGGRLYDDLPPYLAAADPDVLCLQEVVHTPGVDNQWLTYRDKSHVLPQRARFFEEVSAALPDHVAIFSPAAQGELWDGETPYPSQWGLATFVRRAFPIIGQYAGFVHGTFSPYGYGPHPRARNAHAVRLYDYGKDWPITIAHTHGLRVPGAGKTDTPERLAQADRLAALVSATAEPGDRVVLCGDFNVLPDSETFSVLLKIGLKDLVTGRGYESTRTSHYEKPGRFADYMLVNAPLATAGFDVVRDPEVSDHCPLILTIDGAG